MEVLSPNESDLASAKMTGRLHKPHLGRLPGYGCGDTSMGMQAVIQQARMVGHPFYVPWVDLKTCLLSCS